MISRLARAIRSSAFVAAATLGVLSASGSAHALQYNIAFDEFAITGNENWSGTFEAPEGGGTVTSFNAVIGGVTYNTLPTNFLFLTIGPPTLSGSQSYLSGPFLNTAFVTGSPPIAVLLLGSNNLWGNGSCNIATIATCVRSIQLNKGTYSISPVPVPAALPLFATGVAALGYLGRRKRKAAAAIA